MNVNLLRIELAVKGIDTNHLTDEQLKESFNESLKIITEVWNKAKKALTEFTEKNKEFFIAVKYEGYKSNNHRKYNNKHTIRFKQIEKYRRRT